MAIISSPSVQRNKSPILEVLKEYNLDGGRLLEIGSGTGEHGIFIANHFKKLHWITSDIKENHQNLKI